MEVELDRSVFLYLNTVEVELDRAVFLYLNTVEVGGTMIPSKLFLIVWLVTVGRDYDTQ